MRKTVLSVIAAATLGLCACSDFEKSGNGRLDGFWQLTSVDTLASGRTANVAERMIFWSVQAGLVELSDRHTGEPYDDRFPSIFYRFERQGDCLKLLGEPKPRINNRMRSDAEVANSTQCGFYGLSDEGETLQILRLEDKKMTLQSEFFRMYFRKY